MNMELRVQSSKSVVIVLTSNVYHIVDWCNAMCSGCWAYGPSNLPYLKYGPEDLNELYCFWFSTKTDGKVFSQTFSEEMDLASRRTL